MDKRREFESIVKEYSEQLYWMIRRIVLTHDDANDVLQNTFLKAWNAFDSFQGGSKVSTWLSRIAINESLDFLRRNKFVASASSEDLSVANALLADDYFDGSETEAMLQEAIAQLPDVQRTVFNLRYYEEMKYSEMSKVLNTSEGALKASYHIAVKKITDFFKARD
ncbi:MULTISPECIES: RNA polymerase sigma factor [unclassified Prevotella]|uniref:RNA polymerase sigma factor n=1 Tax=unclassified Prevotella TaxID=2638335 RepID=UPI0005683C02|nr:MULTISPECIES: sigma-70 family RNA polymerase sigma factor [unclassified Prevotella]